MKPTYFVSILVLGQPKPYVDCFDNFLSAGCFAKNLINGYLSRGYELNISTPAMWTLSQVDNTYMNWRDVVIVRVYTSEEENQLMPLNHLFYESSVLS